MGKSCRIRKQKKTAFDLPTHHRFSAEEVRVIVNGEKAQLLEDVFFRIVALSAMVINDNYGKLNKKETRIENYASLLSERLEQFSLNSSEEEEKVIEVLKRAGIKMVKDGM